MKIFVACDKYVHLQSAINSEYSLCGDAFDGCDTDGQVEHTETDKRVVTCPKCVEEIHNCRRVITI